MTSDIARAYEIATVRDSSQPENGHRGASSRWSEPLRLVVLAIALAIPIQALTDREALLGLIALFTVVPILLLGVFASD